MSTFGSIGVGTWWPGAEKCVNAEAIVVIVMVAIVFRRVDDAVALSDSRYKVRNPESLTVHIIPTDHASAPHRPSHVISRCSS